jgi:hypothetical protein
MTDQFLKHLRREPRPEFARDLRERLRAGESTGAVRPAAVARAPSWLTLSFAAAAQSCSRSPFAFAAPYAQAFIDMFRMRNFAAVAVDASRLEQLRKLGSQSGRDQALRIFDRVDELKKPDAPRMFLDAASASRAAGMSLLMPASLPNGLTADTIRVAGPGAMRLTASAAKLRSLLSTLGLNDVQVPPGLDGAEITLHEGIIVAMAYTHDQQRVMFVQSHIPEIEAPRGLDLQRVGEMGLRIVGLSAEDARRFASTIDWRSTVVIPVPTNANAIREADVRGHRGLLGTTDDAPRGSGGDMKRHRGPVLLWSRGPGVRPHREHGERPHDHRQLLR